MTQQEAARILSAHFYDWRYNSIGVQHRSEVVMLNFMGPFVPTKLPAAAFANRRSELLPEDFRFTWPLLPKNAHYV